MNITANTAKQQFGFVLDASYTQPVAITKYGRKVAYMVSAQEYERLQAIEDEYWGNRAKDAMSEGYLSPEETMSELHKIAREKGVNV